MPSSTPVVIVGGGPVGLFLSILLSEFHVPHILLERQSLHQRFEHPQAHFLNTRTMELLRSRNCIPNQSETLYDMIQSSMPPVAHWQSFRYGTSIFDCRKPLAEIVHPVQRPLQANCDAKGVLLENDAHRAKFGANTPEPTTTPNQNSDLSPCTVGHLPQHTFGRILYDHAVRHCQRENSGNQILYGTMVEHIEFVQSSVNEPMIRVVASREQGQKQEYFTDLVVAADGAHSTVRNQLWNHKSRAFHDRLSENHLPPVEQHLINIHVQIPIEVARQIHSEDNFAMLYSIYTPEVISMVVCHTIGEYVIQIPYFPPYQTLEDDFSTVKVMVLLDSIFGFPNISQHCKIRSIAPWTMKTWIADHYFQCHTPANCVDDSTAAGVALVGDAAHVFPPSGGFGMNTGLQDVHNLAWKIAAYRLSNKSSQWPLKHVLESYERERRAVAIQNAALSIRNYERLLEVTKTFYLDAQHPALLCTVLDHSPFPLFLRQQVFRSLLSTALYPLSWLGSSDINKWSPYTNHILNNLRQILNVGAGLPLLFPRYEIGFRYDPPIPVLTDVEDRKSSPILPNTSRTADTIPDAPYLAVGRLVPHVLVMVVAGVERSFPSLKQIVLPTTNKPPPVVISTTDLPAQMTNPKDSRPLFVLLWLVDGVAQFNVSLAEQCCSALADRLGLLVSLALVVREHRTVTISAPQDTSVQFLTLSECSDSQSFSFFTNSGKFQCPYAVLIRPDGHTAGIATTSSECSIDVDCLVDRLLQGVVDLC